MLKYLIDTLYQSTNVDRSEENTRFYCRYSIYLLGPPHREPHLLKLLQGLAAQQVLCHGHLLAGDGQSGHVGGKAGLVLAGRLAKVSVEFGDAEPVPGRLDGVAVEQHVLRGQLDVAAVRSCTYLYVKVSDKESIICGVRIQVMSEEMVT